MLKALHWKHCKRLSILLFYLPVLKYIEICFFFLIFLFNYSLTYPSPQSGFAQAKRYGGKFSRQFLIFDDSEVLHSKALKGNECAHRILFNFCFRVNSLNQNWAYFRTKRRLVFIQLSITRDNSFLSKYVFFMCSRIWYNLSGGDINDNKGISRHQFSSIPPDQLAISLFGIKRPTSNFPISVFVYSAWSTRDLIVWY